MSALLKTEVLTFGCRLNAGESETIAGLSSGFGGVMINSFTVTIEAASAFGLVA